VHDQSDSERQPSERERPPRLDCVGVRNWANGPWGPWNSTAVARLRNNPGQNLHHYILLLVVSNPWPLAPIRLIQRGLVFISRPPALPSAELAAVNSTGLPRIQPSLKLAGIFELVAKIRMQGAILGLASVLQSLVVC
jgi:hypothetical protein